MYQKQFIILGPKVGGGRGKFFRVSPLFSFVFLWNHFGNDRCGKSWSENFSNKNGFLPRQNKTLWADKYDDYQVSEQLSFKRKLFLELSQLLYILINWMYYVGGKTKMEIVCMHPSYSSYAVKQFILNLFYFWA